MTPIEAGKLLGHCAMFDNRQASRLANEAWSMALRDLPFDADLLVAVARFYGTPPKEPGQRLWIQPHDVRSHRLAIRRERLGETLPAYLPPSAPETGAQFVARRQAQLDAIATGKIAGVPVGSLDGGPALAVGRRIKDLGEVGWTVPDEDEPVAAVRRRGPLGRHCPKCLSPIGRPCRRGALGSERKVPHRERMDGPTAGPEGLSAARETTADIEARRAASRAALAALPPDAVIEPDGGFQASGGAS